MPARIASSSTPSARAAQIAPSAFARLKRPRSFRSMPSRSSSGVKVARVRQLRGEPPPPLVADVHDRALGLLEQRALRLEVALHRAVEVEVVLRQVREDEHREARAREPALAPAIDVASITHERSPASSICAEEPLQVDRLGRVQPGRACLAADAPLDVRRAAPGSPPGGVEDRVEQERRRRLAVRPGDRGDLELARRVAEEERGGGPHRGADARHDELRQRRRRRAARRRARPRRPPAAPARSCPSTFAPDAEEERARRDGARVVGEVEDLDRGRAERARVRVRRSNVEPSGRYSARQCTGASGGTDRYCRSNLAI